MKKTILILSTALMASVLFLSFVGGKLTLKERIDQAKEVKVYFSITDIEHSPNTESVGQTKGTGCSKFNETTKLPEGYTSASKKILQMLNDGFKTTAFIEGDIKSVPVKTNKLGIEITDWVKQGEQLTATVTFLGKYNVENNALPTDVGVSLENSMTITAYMKFFEIVEGELKMIVMTKYLANVSSKAKKTKECNTYDYFVENFPANSLVESFNSSVEGKVAGFTEKRMKKYEKAMKKKKK